MGRTKLSSRSLLSKNGKNISWRETTKAMQREDEEWSTYYPSSRYSTAPRFVRASLPSTQIKTPTSGLEISEIYQTITASTASTSAVTVEDAQGQTGGKGKQKAVEEIRCEACEVLVRQEDWKRHVTGLGHQFAKDGKDRIIPPAHFQVSVCRLFSSPSVKVLMS